MHVNTVDPTEVKIVAGFILSQQSQPRLGQKQYLDMAADVPKQARRTGLRGELMARLDSGDQSGKSIMMISFFFFGVCDCYDFKRCDISALKWKIAGNKC